MLQNNRYSNLPTATEKTNLNTNLATLMGVIFMFYAALPAQALKITHIHELEKQVSPEKVYKGTGFSPQGMTDCVVTAGHVVAVLKSLPSFTNPHFDIGVVSINDNTDIKTCIQLLQKTDLPDNLEEAKNLVIALAKKENQKISNVDQAFPARLVTLYNRGSVAVYVVKGDPGLGVSGSPTYSNSGELLGVAIEVSAFFSKKTMTKILTDLLHYPESELLKMPNITTATTPLNHNLEFLKSRHPGITESELINLTVEKTMTEQISIILKNNPELQQNLRIRKVTINDFTQGEYSLINSLIIHKGLFKNL